MIDVRWNRVKVHLPETLGLDFRCRKVQHPPTALTIRAIRRRTSRFYMVSDSKQTCCTTGSTCLQITESHTRNFSQFKNELTDPPSLSLC